jgi:hypothetical protein
MDSRFRGNDMIGEGIDLGLKVQNCLQNERTDSEKAW